MLLGDVHTPYTNLNLRQTDIHMRHIITFGNVENFAQKYKVKYHKAGR